MIPMLLQAASVPTGAVKTSNTSKDARCVRQESKPTVSTPAATNAKPAGRPFASAGTEKPTPSAQPKSAALPVGRMAPHIKRKLKGVLEQVLYADKLKTFHNAVSTQIAPDYYDVIKKPMHLKLVKQKLDKGEYEDEAQFKEVCAVTVTHVEPLEVRCNGRMHQ
jgi:hypothetical protein